MASIIASLRAIAWGDRLSDKLTIAADVGLGVLAPVGAVARALGRPIDDPRRFSYTLDGPAGLFSCPPGPARYYLGAGGRYQRRLCALIDELDGGVFVDVGASIGQITVRAARRCDHVIAIEPHPMRFKHLQRNVELNRLDNVTCVWTALGSTTGHTGLYDVDPALGSRRRTASTVPGRGRRFDVPVSRLDDVVGDATFLRLGVEGFEADILLGAAALLERRPTVFVGGLRDASLGELRTLLHGYRLHELGRSEWLAEPPPALFAPARVDDPGAAEREAASRLRRPAPAFVQSSSV